MKNSPLLLFIPGDGIEACCEISFFHNNDIQEDMKKAIEYFTNIVDPILDRHFRVAILLPFSKNTDTKITFKGGMKSTPANIYNFNLKSVYMRNKIENTVSLRAGNFIYFMGNVKTNPDIYYVSYSQFSLSNTQLRLRDKYLVTNPVDNYIMTSDEVDKNPELNAIKDINTRNKVRDFTMEYCQPSGSFI
ncbi:hypothetical protein FQR65_LT15336 [Abscondita terminalis]|nr:hypothetical protein FQR65_LT15336 [Abscondita terminalis]